MIPEDELLINLVRAAVVEVLEESLRNGMGEQFRTIVSERTAELDKLTRQLVDTIIGQPNPITGRRGDGLDQVVGSLVTTVEQVQKTLANQDAARAAGEKRRDRHLALAVALIGVLGPVITVLVTVWFT